MTIALRPMRETVRRKLIKRAQVKGEKEAANLIHAHLQKGYRALKRDLRRSNFRHRLKKAQRDAGELAKAVDFNWNGWKSDFGDALLKSMSPMVNNVQDVEGDYWLSRGMEYKPADPVDVIAAYEIRTGRQIKDVGDDTQQRVLTMITDWYNGGDQSLPELVDKLGQFFDENRAEMIARTESAFIASQIAQDAMSQMGITKWNFDLAPEEGPYPCQQCIDYADDNPHDITDDFPPLHPNDRCGVVYVMDDGDSENGYEHD